MAQYSYSISLYYCRSFPEFPVMCTIADAWVIAGAFDLYNCYIFFSTPLVGPIK